MVLHLVGKQNFDLVLLQNRLEIVYYTQKYLNPTLSKMLVQTKLCNYNSAQLTVDMRRYLL